VNLVIQWDNFNGTGFLPYHHRIKILSVFQVSQC
jgi:hypothetical protein